MKQLYLIKLICLFLCTNICSQINVNREWLVDGGNPVNTDWVNSLLVPSGGLVRAGNINAGAQGADLFIVKYDNRGDTVWYRDFNSSGSNNDYATGIALDPSGNIFVCGVTDNGTSDDFDVLIMKLNSSGTFLWQHSYGSSYNKNDIAVALKADGIGNVYVLVNSESDTNMTDILVLKYTSAGSILHDERFDMAGLPDIGVDIDMKPGMNHKFWVAGASAETTNEWEYIILDFDSSLGLNALIRDTIPGNSYNQPYAFTRDSHGSFYVTGKSSSNGINYDIRTIKIDSSHALIWSAVTGGSSEDAGICIAADTGNNLIVGGYKTGNSGKKDILLLKYDNTTGAELWRHTQSSKDQTGDAFVKAVAVNGQNEIYALSQQKTDGKNQAVVSKFSPSGSFLWERKLEGNVAKEKPTNIHVANDGSVYVTSIRDTGSLAEYQLARFTEFRQDTSVVYDSLSVPVYKAKELIVRFKQGALDTALINDTRKEFATLEDFLTPAAKDTMFAYMGDIEAGMIMERTFAVKIFKQLKTSHQTTTSRLGETIKIPDFYNTLLLEFPDGVEIEDMYTLFNDTLRGIIAYTEPNFIGQTLTGANDTYYSEQISLNSDNNGIYVEEAWDIIPSGGASFIKCGIFDTGVDWQHEDFGYDGFNVASTKVKGWNFQGGYPITSSPIGDNDQFTGHGTCVAGIVGAIRNNSIGIAGIAGGDGLNSNFGVSIYGMMINMPGAFFSLPINYIADAVVTSAIDDSGLDYAYGLHIMNHSWGISSMSSPPSWYNDSNITLLTETAHFANRAGVTFVAARGNEGENDIVYPATLYDDWVLNISGTGIGGNFKVVESVNGLYFDYLTSSFGRNIDIGAPASSIIVHTVSTNNNYVPFNGTSSSAPHVSGTVALMMSYHNDTIPNYKNLAPEDCEWILQKSAIDRGAQGYDDSTGYGLLCAGGALKLIEFPFRKIEHFGTNSQSVHTKTKDLFATDMTVFIPERFQDNLGNWVMSGNYKVDIYEINAQINHQLGENDTIIGYWPRGSSSTPWGLPQVSGGLNLIYPYEKVSINCTPTECNLKGYIYKAKTMAGVPLGWWPQDTSLSEIKFEYSLLTRDTSQIDTIITNFNTIEQGLNNLTFDLYPNPTINVNNIWIKNIDKETELNISILDISGRLIRRNQTMNVETENYLFTSDVSNLKPGIYFYNIRFDDKNHNLKFIKQ